MYTAWETAMLPLHQSRKFLAETEGFEPTVEETSTIAFQAIAFNQTRPHLLIVSPMGIEPMFSP